MSATSHFIYDWQGCTSANIPCGPDGTIWRFPLPKGLPRRKVYFGMSFFAATFYTNFRSALIFRNCGEEVLRLPYFVEDQDVGGGVLMFSFPWQPVSTVYEKAPANSINVAWMGLQHCFPGFDLRIIADEVQWWYDLTFAPVVNIGNGVIFMGVFSEADPPAPTITVPTFDAPSNTALPAAPAKR